MSGVKHTRGPWVVHSFDGQELNVIPDPDSGHPDTYLGVCTINTWPGERSTRRNEANARLIAAAPELLEALMTARETIRALHGPNHWDIYDRCSPEMKSINAAIARATGDHPEKGGAL